MVEHIVRLFHNLPTYGRTEQYAVFTYQTSNTQFIDAPEDVPVGPKHVELSNILGGCGTTSQRMDTPSNTQSSHTKPATYSL
jgi:hypothetical protein